MNEGMIKLIYSSSFNDNVDIGARLVESPDTLVKSASTIFGCDYDSIKPDKDHVGIHLVALGDFEHYGSNRNGDSFPKEACIKYHHTFVKCGHVFKHHRNKDPNLSLGKVVKSAYNPQMGRIELFIHAHKDKARDELQKLAETGDLAFSMACKVSFDRCSICNTLRKSASDPNQCDHVRYNLGKILDDGKIVCTHNDEPIFFDISFVTRPADRIAWQLKTANNEILDSTKLAELEGVIVPDYIAISSDTAKAKYELLVKMAEFEQLYNKLAGSVPQTSRERYFLELVKAANVKIDDTLISSLREQDINEALFKLAKAGIILDCEGFFKYALGEDYDAIKGIIPYIKHELRNIYSNLQKAGTCSSVCNETMFDVDTNILTTSLPWDKKAQYSLIGPERDQRIIDNTLEGKNICIDMPKEIVLNTNMTIGKLAAKYGAYKLAALNAILSINNDTDIDRDALLAIAVAQNKVN